MKACLTLLIIAPHFSLQQYGNHYENDLHMGHQYNYDSEYPEEYYQRSSRRHKKKHARPRDYDSGEYCSCDCRVCDPKPCCRPVCTCETSETDQNFETAPNSPPDPAPDPSYGGTNVVFVPYPFPLVVPGQQLPMPPAETITETPINNNHKSKTKTTPSCGLTTVKETTKHEATLTTTKGTTKGTTKESKDTTIATTKPNSTKKSSSTEDSKELSTAKPSLRQLINILKKNPNIRIGISKTKKSRAIRPLRPTTTFPKYGIVPLPDHLLDSLISQVRNVKDLQSYA